MPEKGIANNATAPVAGGVDSKHPIKEAVCVHTQKIYDACREGVCRAVGLQQLRHSQPHQDHPAQPGHIERQSASQLAAYTASGKYSQHIGNERGYYNG